MPLPKACIFDAYGTLFDLRFPLTDYKNVLQGKEKELMNLWREKQLSYTWLRGLMDSYKPFWEVTQDALRHCFDALDIDDQETFEGIVNHYLKPSCYAEVIPTLQVIRKMGIKTAILSNGSPEMLSSGISNAGIDPLLDEVFSVDLVKSFKPSPKVYQIPLDHWQLSKEDIFFFSSNSWDIAGASHFGFTTIWVNRFDASWEQLDVTPSFEVPQLQDFLEQLV